MLKGLLKRWFSSGKAQGEAEPDDVMRIARKVGALADRTSMEIFSAYRTELLSRPITYIVPAVWGAIKDAEPDPIQKEMNEKISPVVEDICRAFALDGLDPTRRFALGFLVRGYLISKITYMIEASRNQGAHEFPEEATPPHSDPFDNGTPYGHA